ncbi:TPA: pyrroline-5-carboxylate reductase [Candidatus Bathyarchaeota archaeon]|nr:pyrroline-5-carboxylate reductase [Candidatus Bathyarchaeota archaeon]
MVGTVAVIGAGVIGGAIVKCLQESEEVGKVIATRRSLESLKELKELGAEVTTDNRAAAKKADIVFLCVKPGDVSTVLKGIEKEIKGKLVISSAAIIPLEFYKDAVPGARYIRCMPNIAALAKASFTAFTCDAGVTAEDKTTAKTLLDTMGTSMEVEEKYMDAVTGLSGSGPAFVAIVIDAMMFGGLKVGLPRELSLRSSAQSVLGAAKLVLDGTMKPNEIAEMVTTPGGTTIDGIYEIEDGKLRTALMNAVEAATKKSANMRPKWEKSA